jgi:predicted porin
VYAGLEDKQIDSAYNQKATHVGAKYDLGFAGIGAYYGVKDGATQPTVNTGEVKQTRISALVPLKDGFSLHTVYLKDETATQATTDFDGYKLAVVKSFSKRTAAYAAYVVTDYDSISTADNNTYVVGIRHSF